MRLFNYILTDFKYRINVWRLGRLGLLSYSLRQSPIMEHYRDDPECRSKANDRQKIRSYREVIHISSRVPGQVRKIGKRRDEAYTPRKCWQFTQRNKDTTNEYEGNLINELIIWEY